MKIGGITQGERTVMLIKGEVLRRFPGTVIYASKAIIITTPEGNEPTLPSGDRGGVEEITEPIFRGTIQPDITFFGFEMSIEQLRGNNTTEDPGYFFILQEQPSEPRFGIDEGDGQPSVNPELLTAWDDLTWDYVTLSSTSNGYIDLENGPLVGKEIENVKWGSHSADLANILLQQPVRIAVHARELVRSEES